MRIRYPARTGVTIPNSVWRLRGAENPRKPRNLVLIMRRESKGLRIHSIRNGRPGATFEPAKSQEANVLLSGLRQALEVCV